MSALTCGLDVHKEWNDVTVRRNSDGEIAMGVRKLPNDRILDFPGKNPDISRVAMEASKSVVPLYRELKEAGYDDVLVSHPKKTRLIADTIIKSDRVDSEAISELARLSALPLLAYIPPPEIAELREKVRRRAFLVRMRTKLMNKIRMQLLYEGIKGPDENEFEPFTRKGAERLNTLKLDSVDTYMRLIRSLNAEVNVLSTELKAMAPFDEDAKLLMTIPAGCGILFRSSDQG